MDTSQNMVTQDYLSGQFDILNQLEAHYRAVMSELEKGCPEGMDNLTYTGMYGAIENVLVTIKTLRIRVQLDMLGEQS